MAKPTPPRQTSVENMPYLNHMYGEETLRSFYENTWQADHADQLFSEASEVAASAAFKAMRAAESGELTAPPS